jgi:hypothetical protein
MARRETAGWRGADNGAGTHGASTSEGGQPGQSTGGRTHNLPVQPAGLDVRQARRGMRYGKED